MRVEFGRFRTGALLLALSSAACSGTSVTELTGPEAIRCQIALGSAAATAPSSGTNLTVAVSVERDCTWSAQSQAAWLQVSPATGQGEASVTVAVASNPSTSPRAGSVLVNDQPFQVTQNGAAPPPPVCIFALSPSTRTIGDGGGTRSVRVTTGPACVWTAASTVSWISVTSAAAGTGTSDITYRVDRNRSSDDRVGSIVISGSIHLVRQSGD